VLNIKPLKLSGNWAEGFALDIHTLSSEFLGYDDFDHPVFSTKYTEIGEVLYRLKSKSDKSVISEILDTASSFLKDTWKIAGELNFIIPVPPSNTARKFQPVVELAKGLGGRLTIPVVMDALRKIKKTPQLKGVVDYSERMRILQGAFTVTESLTRGKRILLFDDLYRSGATLGIITQTLMEQGKTDRVYVLCLTKTRSKS